MYKALRLLIGLALGFYFRRIERFHPERAPVQGPVLFTSNHPNSLTDSFIIGASVPRKVSFVATVQLFRLAPIKWILLRSGVIPINRVKDNPKAMKTVAVLSRLAIGCSSLAKPWAFFRKALLTTTPI